MARIFNSHSKRDERIKNFFFRGFSGTQVIPIWQEYENPAPNSTIDQHIEEKIMSSSALFVLLSDTVEKLPFTREWIVWESGKADQKDIWVFEPYEALQRISVVIPRFNHYVRYQLNPSWREYIHSIVRTYDDSGLLPLMLAGSGIGAAVNSGDRTTGGLLGALGGAVIDAIHRPRAPLGRIVQCLKCDCRYNVHLPGDCGYFRCARCNNLMFL